VFGVLDGGAAEDRRMDRTDDEGRFDIDLGESFQSDGRRMEIRVRTPRYECWRGVPPKPGETLEVQIAERRDAPRPSRVLGAAIDVDDRPLRGPLEIDMQDEMFSTRRQTVFADAQGAFEMAGLWPGTWRLSLDSGPPVEVAVRDGDEARVRLRAKHGAAWFAVTPWTDDMAKTRESLRTLLASRNERPPGGGDPIDDTAEGALLLQLNASWRASLPRREVVVVGLPVDFPSVLLADGDGNHWRAEVKDGVARFPSLSVGKWQFSVDLREGFTALPREAEIVPGDGPQTIDLSPPPR
jgi:hypothetical protein